ncbi:hypothetical protein CL622_08475 [archaeon]|nr:hypothetical protein [archaeon]
MLLNYIFYMNCSITELSIVEKSVIKDLHRDIRMIIIQNEQITKQLLYIRDEITKIKLEMRKKS